MGVKKTSESSVSCTGNEESSTMKTESRKGLMNVYSCGICCQSFSTKEETIHCFHIHRIN